MSDPAVAAAPEGTEAEPKAPHRRKLVGRVTSDKMDKTIVVETRRIKLDPVYKKYIRVRQRYKAHDENNEYRIGDLVEIMEHRPLSKEKRWKAVRLVERAASTE